MISTGTKRDLERAELMKLGEHDVAGARHDDAEEQ